MIVSETSLPGVFEVFAKFVFVNLFIKVDFPTFDLPQNTISET